MTTSAQALNEVLSYVSKRAQNEQRFLEAVANFLEIEGEHAEVEALKLLYHIYTKIQEDISNLPLGDAEIRQLHGYLSHFAGLHSLAHVHLNVGNAKSNFLKSDHLVGLMNIHMALSGHCSRLELDAETKEIVSEARELAQKITASKLPDRARYILAKRLIQIASAIENFGLFGPKALEEELEALLGAIAVHSGSAKNAENSSLMRQAYDILVRSLTGLQRIDSGLSTSISVLEKGKQISDLLP